MATEWKIENFPYSKVDSHKVNEMENKTIILLTPEEMERVPDGTKVYSIFGNCVIKGTDYIDNDIRGGHLAYGVPIEQWNS